MRKFYVSAICTLLIFCLSGVKGWGQNVSATWGANSNTAWYTGSNWVGNSYAGSQGTAATNTNIATFTSAFTGTAPGINLNTASLNLGAISIDNTRSTALSIGNSSGIANTNQLRLYGATVNSVANVIIRNNGTGLLTLNNSNAGMTVVLGNSTDNIIVIDNTGSVTIAPVIADLSGGARKLTLAGLGSGTLTLSGVNTYSGNTTISSGTLALSGSGSIASSPNIIIGSGGTFNVTGLTNALSLASGQTLNASATGSNTTGTLTVSSTRGLTLSTGGLIFTGYNGGVTSPLTVTGATAGSLALNNAPITVTTTSALDVGSYTLIAKSASATGVTGTPGTLTINGSGLGAGTIGALSVSGGQLILTVTSNSSPTLAITGTTSHGSACPNTSANSIQYTITNNGAVQADGIQVSSDNTQFAASGLSSTSIAASGGTATFNVVFTPTSSGAKSATITVTSSTSGSNSPTTSLSGTGTTAVTQTVTSSAASSISSSGATLNGNVTALGVCPATTEKGFVYAATATNNDPLVGGTGVTKTPVASLVTGAYTLALTGLSSATGYTFKAYVYDGVTYTYGSTQTFSTVATAPTAQPTALTRSAVSTTGMTLSWTAATGGAAGYIILRTTASGTTYPNTNPVNGTTYTAGSTLGNATVEYVGNSLSTAISSTLTSNSRYSFSILSYNGSGATVSYYTTVPLQGQYFTLASKPTLNSTAPSVFSRTSSSLTLANTIDGNGTAVYIIAKAGSSVDAFPVDGSSYSASNTFGNGSQLGTGNYVVATGNQTVSGLSPATTYHFAAIDYNGSTGTGAESYYTAVPSTFSATTLATTPTTAATSVVIGTRTNNSIQLSWTNGNGAGRIVVVRQGGTPVAPSAGTDYAVNSSSFSDATNGTTASGSVVVYKATGNSVTVTGLTAATSYTISIYEYNGSSSTINYSSALTSSATSTLANEPTTAPSAITYFNLSASGFTIGWTNGNGTGRIVVVKQGSAVDSDPVDGTTYTPNTTFGNGNQLGTGNYVVYASTGSSVTIAGLTSNTMYHVAIYEYNGSSTTINYLTTAVTGNQTSLVTAPTTAASNVILTAKTNNSISLSWTTGNGARRIVVARATSTSNVLASGGTEYTVTNSGSFTGPSNDVTGTGNIVVYNGTGNSVTVTNLSPQTSYGFYVYEYNGTGSTTNYSSAANLLTQFTLSNEPIAHAASFIATANGATSIALTFSAASTITNAAGYLILRKTSPFVAGDYPVDGNAYSQGAAVGSNGAVVNTIVTSISTTTASGVSVTADGTFFFLLVPFNWDGSTPGTRNYYTDATIPAQTVSTPSAASDVIAVSSSEAVTISSLTNDAAPLSSSTGTQVWQITIRDGGATVDNDALPTIVTGLTLTQNGSSNVNSWTTSIRSVGLFDGNTLIASGTVNNFTIAFSGFNVSAPDGGTKTLSIRLSLNTALGATDDGKKFVFNLTNSNVSVLTDGTSSGISSFPVINSNTSSNVIDITATKLAFVQQPSNVNINATMTPIVTVAATDVNGNRDTDFSGVIRITSTGTLTGTDVDVSAISGLASFNSLVHTVTGTGITLVARRGTPNLDWNVSSNTFNVAIAPVVIAGWDFFGQTSPSTFAATTFNSGLVLSNSASNISRGAGASSSTASNSFRTIGFQNNGISTSNTDFFQVTLTPATGFNMSLSTIDANMAGTASFAVSPGVSHQFAYSTDGNTFTLIGSPTTTIGTPASLSIDLTNISALQNITTGTTVTLRYYASGQTSTGGWGFTSASSGTNGLQFSGFVDCATPASFNVTGGGSACINTSGVAVGLSGSETGMTYQLQRDGVDIGNTITGTGSAISFGNQTTSGTYTVIAKNLNGSCTNQITMTGNAVVVINTLTVGGTSGSSQVICAASTPSDLTLSGNTGTVMKWQKSSDAAFTSPTDINSATTTLTGATIGALNSDTYFRAVVQNGACAATNSSSTLVQIGFTWTGTTNNTWNTASNWSCGSVPTSSDYVYIPSGGNQPELNGGISIGDIQLSSGSTLQIGAGNTLTVSGAISGSGTITGSPTSSLVISDDAGTISFTQTNSGTRSLKNFTLSAGASATLGNSLEIVAGASPGEVSVGAGAVLTTGGNLILRSNANGTARILAGDKEEQHEDDYIVGNVTVERFVPSKGGRKSIFLGVPVTATVDASWQQQIYVTGPGTGGTICNPADANNPSQPGTNSNGFDASGANQATIFTYNPANAANNRWVGIADSSTLLTPGLGYRVLVRGSRTQGCVLLTNTSTAPDAVTLSATGPVAQGNISVTLQNGFNLLSNPYPCEINFASVFGDNNGSIGNKYWTFNPDNNSGAYTTWNGTLMVNGGSLTNPARIASGQSFFVQSSTAGTITDFFRESQKTANAETQTGLFRNANALEYVRVGYKRNDGSHLDEVIISFSTNPNATKVYNELMDARSMNEANQIISSLKGTDRLAIQTRPSITQNDTVALRVTSTSQGNFKLLFSEYTSLSNVDVILLDGYSGASQIINNNPTYSFSIDANAASQGSDRFKLVFSPSTVLPIDFIALTVRSRGNGAEVMWKVSDEKNAIRYEVERSADGRSFEQKGIVQAKGNSTTEVSYSWVDNSVNGTVYYRIKGLSAAGVKYSPVVKYVSGDQNIFISLYPNPAKDLLNVMTSKQLTGTMSIRISNSFGQVVWSRNSMPSANNIVQVNTSGFAAGMYIIEISDLTGMKVTSRFVKH